MLFQDKNAMSQLMLLLLALVLATFVVPSTAQFDWEPFFNNTCNHDDVMKQCGDSLVCVNFRCTFCTNDTQCLSKHDTYSCKKAYSQSWKQDVNVCGHKNLFPIDMWDIMNTVSNFIGGTLSGAGGIGGGGVFVPLLHIFGQFPPTLAIPLSKAMIFGGAVLNVIVMFFQKHPEDKNRSLIDYDAALVFEPFTLLGTTVGVICNITFPEWLTVALLIIILGITTIRTGQKGIQVARKEIGELRKKKDNSIQTPESKIDTSHDTSKEETPLLKVADETPEAKELQQIILNERKTPFGKFFILLGCWILIIILSLLRGGHGAPSVVGIPACSWLYWLLFGISFPIIAGITFTLGIVLLIRHKRKVDLGYKFQKGDIVWTPKTITLYPFLCFIAGIMAALLGIGGGMIKGPLLLELGVDGNVASATSSFMVFFTSSITSVQYIILGRMPYDYGLWFGALGFLSSLLGQILIGYPARRWKLTFIIILSVCIVIGAATGLMGGVGIYNTVVDIKEGVYMGFKPPC